MAEEAALPPAFDGMPAAQETVMYTEGGPAFLPEYLAALDKLAPELREKVENGPRVTPAMLLEAYALADSCRVAFDGCSGAGSTWF